MLAAPSGQLRQHRAGALDARGRRSGAGHGCVPRRATGRDGGSAALFERTIVTVAARGPRVVQATDV